MLTVISSNISNNEADEINKTLRNTPAESMLDELRNNNFYNNYLADDLDINEDDPGDLQVLDVNDVRPNFVSELTPKKQESVMDMINNGISHKDFIEFSYTTKRGSFIGRRLVEPHYTFDAQNDPYNMILVCFDHTVINSRTGQQGAIRSFIVNNIHEPGIRYAGEESQFVFRPEIIR